MEFLILIIITLKFNWDSLTNCKVPFRINISLYRELFRSYFAARCESWDINEFVWGILNEQSMAWHNNILNNKPHLSVRP